MVYAKDFYLIDSASLIITVHKTQEYIVPSRACNIKSRIAALWLNWKSWSQVCFKSHSCLRFKHFTLSCLLLLSLSSLSWYQVTKPFPSKQKACYFSSTKYSSDTPHSPCNFVDCGQHVLHLERCDFLFIILSEQRTGGEDKPPHLPLPTLHYMRKFPKVYSDSSWTQHHCKHQRWCPVPYSFNCTESFCNLQPTFTQSCIFAHLCWCKKDHLCSSGLSWHLSLIYLYIKQTGFFWFTHLP